MKRLLATLFLLAVMIMAAPAQDRKAAIDAYNRGTELMHQHKYEEALGALNQSLQAYPGFLPALMNRAVCNDALRKPQEALKDYDEALRQSPGNPVVLYNRSTHYEEAKQFDLALKDLGDALKAQDQDFETTETNLHLRRDDVYIERAALYEELGQHQESIADTTAALKLNPGSVRAYLLRAEAFFVTDKLDDGMQDIDAAMQLQPNNSDVLAARCEGLVYEGKFDDAVQLGEKAMQLNPHSSIAAMACASAHFSRGETDKAVAQIAQAIRLDQRNYPAYLISAWINTAAGRNGLAAGDADLALRNVGYEKADAPILGMLATINHRIAHEDQEGDEVLSRALEHCSQHQWEYGLLKFLHHDLSADDLLANAPGPRQMAEAHLLLALDAMVASNSSAARDHLTWISETYKGHDVVVPVAQALLKKLP